MNQEEDEEDTIRLNESMYVFVIVLLLCIYIYILISIYIYIYRNSHKDFENALSVEVQEEMQIGRMQPQRGFILEGNN